MERAIKKNGQSRETGNIGYTRHKRKTNQNKKNTNPPPRKLNQ